jgi:hypothetical protein
MPYYAVTLPSGVRYSILPPSTDYSAVTGCEVYRWARRSGKNGSGLHSSGLKPLNDNDHKQEQRRRYQKQKEREAQVTGH